MASSTVTTFATLFGKTKAQVIAENLLDDGNFDPTGYVSGTLTKYNGGAPTSGNYGTSLDQPNNASGNDSTYNYSFSGIGSNVGAKAVSNSHYGSMSRHSGMDAGLVRAHSESSARDGCSDNA